MIIDNVVILDDSDKITCRLCGKRMKRVYGKHMENHAKFDGVGIKKYREMYPCAPIQTDADRISNSKSSGLHMKTEKYKQLFSDKFKGDKNPNHKIILLKSSEKQGVHFLWNL